MYADIYKQQEKDQLLNMQNGMACPQLFIQKSSYDPNCQVDQEQASTPLLPPCSPQELYSGDIVLLIGEPGMHKTNLARELVKGKQATRVKIFSMYAKNKIEGFLEELKSLSKAAVLAARQLVKKPVHVLIDAFPPADERELCAFVEQIRKMSQAGCGIVITLRPEAEQLREELPEARGYTTGELLYRKPYIFNEQSHGIWAKTHGIPDLVSTFSSDLDIAFTHYGESLKRVVAGSLRDGLPIHEQRIRLTLMLLGKADFAAVSSVLGKLDLETLSWLSFEAPFFGIDMQTMNFCCAGIADNRWFKHVLSTVGRASCMSDDLCIKALKYLVEKTDFMRAGLCCSLIKNERAKVALSLKYSVNFVLCSLTHIVKSALLYEHQQCEDDIEEIQYAKLTLALLDEKYTSQKSLCNIQIAADNEQCADFEQQTDANASEQSIICRDSFKRSLSDNNILTLQLLEDMRAADRCTTKKVFNFMPSDSFQEGVLFHTSCKKLLIGGSFKEALVLLKKLNPKNMPETLVDALLVNDKMIVESFLGADISSSDMRAFERANQIIEASNLHRLVTYQRALPHLLKAFCKHGSPDITIDQAIACAERKGDTLLQLIFLLADTVALIHVGNLTGAYVRSERALQVGKSVQASYLYACAQFIRALIRVLLGEAGALREYVSSSTSQNVVSELACMLISMGCDALMPKVQPGALTASEKNSINFRLLSPSYLLPDVRWLVNILHTSFGPISQKFARFMPKPWVLALQPLTLLHGIKENKNQEKASKLGVSSRRLQETKYIDIRKLADTSSHQVYIKLLGAFSVLIDGYPINTERLMRRRGKNLLALLASKSTHVMRRIELVNAIWPDTEEAQGFQRLYEATSTIRSVFDSRNLGFDPFVLNKSGGVIGLNCEIVSCDIDRLIELGNAVNNSDGDAEHILQYALASQDLYIGDLDTSFIKDVRVVTERRDLARRTYVTTMVAGAKAALALAKNQLAVQFGQNAFAYGQTREDAVAILIEALCSAERITEAQETYSRFFRSSMHKSGIPPSKVLRDLAESLELPQAAIV